MLSDRLQIALRTRSPWEAADLGFQLVRSYAKPVWATWALAVLPIALLIGLLSHFLWGNLWVATLLLWWLKPLFDVPILHVLSRAVFGEQISPKQALALAWNKSNLGPMLRWLSYRRLHPSRALYLPVDFLERETGARRNSRTQVLSREQGSPVSLLTIIGVHMEAMLMVSVLMLGLLFVPTEFMSDAMRDVFERLFTEPPIWFEWVEYLAYVAAASVLEPFYVGAGFGLYLNRRMELEAWDIDLSFRDLAARIRKGAGTLAMLCAIFSVGLMFHAPEAFAQDASARIVQGDAAADEKREKPKSNTAASGAQAEQGDQSDLSTEPLPRDSDQTEVAQDDNSDSELPPESTWQDTFGSELVTENSELDRALSETMKSAELNPQQEITQWVSKSPRERRESSSSGGLSMIGELIGFLAQNIVYVILIVLLILIAPYLLQILQRIQPSKKRSREVDALGESDLELPEAIPDNLSAEVQALWQQGQTRAATALLYRASVLKLFEQLGIPMPKGATESQCLRRAQELAHNPEYRGFFAEMVRYWQSVAYANRKPLWEDLQRFLSAWQSEQTRAPSDATHPTAAA
jgi:Domain of unknown function (DUF4129)